MRACASVSECELADVEVVVRAGVLVGEEEVVSESIAEARLAPTLDSRSFQVVLDKIAEIFDVTGVWASNGEIALGLGGPLVQKALHTLTNTIKAIHSLVGRSIVVEARSELSSGWRSWKVTIYSCEPVDCEDSPREIAEASATAMLAMLTGLGLPGRVRGRPTARLLNPLGADKIFVCAGLSFTLDYNAKSTRSGGPAGI